MFINWILKITMLIGAGLSLISCTPTIKEPPITPIDFPTTHSTIGLLPFSKLASDNIKTAIGNQYYTYFETELFNSLKNKGLVVKLIQYPPNQEPFTYEEMEAPAFEIDPEDFAAPEQILAEIAKLGFNQLIFGHLEEISDALYLVARIYSDGKIEPSISQQISITSLTPTNINVQIDKLATGIINQIQNQHHPISLPLPSKENQPPKNREGLYGLDPI